MRAAIPVALKRQIAESRLQPRILVAALLLLATVLPDALTAQCPDGSPSPCARAAPRTTPLPNSVAVLYFDNLSRDTADAYLADGLTEEVIVRLGQVHRIVVKSRYESQRFRGRGRLDPATLGLALNAAHLVTGSVQRGGNRVRVRVELIRAATRERVWGDVFDRSSEDVGIEEEIARMVVQGIIGQLLPEEQLRLSRRETRDPRAHDLYLRGNLSFSRYTEADLRVAIDLYPQALARDSTYAEAYAGISLAWSWLADVWVAPLLRRAWQLDSLSQVVRNDMIDGLFFSRRYADVLALAQGDGGTTWQITEALVRLGRCEEALARLSEDDFGNRASALACANRAGEARETFNVASRDWP